MTEHLAPTLLKLAAPTVAIVVALIASRMRGLSWRTNLGFQKPVLTATVAWLCLWLVWIGICEFIIRALDLAQAQPWPAYPPIIIALRILAIGILGPAAEETVVRGVLLDRLTHTRLGAYGALLVTAIGWSAMHYRYGLATLVLIACDGLLLGLARQNTRSLWCPIAMHIMANLISIAQSLSAV